MKTLAAPCPWPTRDTQVAITHAHMAAIVPIQKQNSVDSFTDTILFSNFPFQNLLKEKKIKTLWTARHNSLFKFYWT